MDVKQPRKVRIGIGRYMRNWFGTNRSLVQTNGGVQHEFLLIQLWFIAVIIHTKTIDPSAETTILKTLRSRIAGRIGITIELSRREYLAALDAMEMQQRIVMPIREGFSFDGCTIQCSSRYCP